MIRGRRAKEWLAALRLPARLVSLDGRVHTVAGLARIRLNGRPDGLANGLTWGGSELRAGSEETQRNPCS